MFVKWCIHLIWINASKQREIQMWLSIAAGIWTKFSHHTDNTRLMVVVPFIC